MGWHVHRTKVPTMLCKTMIIMLNYNILHGHTKGKLTFFVPLETGGFDCRSDGERLDLMRDGGGYGLT